jgi:hypothetical protein
LHYTMLQKHALHKHSNLSSLFVSYEENEVLWIQPLHSMLFSL